MLGILRLQAGTARPVVAVLFWAVAAAGLLRLLRRDRRLGAYTLTLAAGQVAGILLLSPVGLDNAVVFSRYLIPVLPLVLLWVAVALAAPWGRSAGPGGLGPPGPRRPRRTPTRPTGSISSPRLGGSAKPPPLPRAAVTKSPAKAGGQGRSRVLPPGTRRASLSRPAGRSSLFPVGRWLSVVAAALFLAVLVAGGPFADPAVRRTSFLHHNDFVAFHVPRPTLPPEVVPPFYRRLAAEPGGGAVLEVPWSPGWGYSRVPPVYQEIHRRPVLLSTPGARVFAPGRTVLRTLLPPTEEAFLASGARYLVVHSKPAWEEDRLLRAGAPEPSRMSPDLRRGLRVAGRGRRGSSPLAGDRRSMPTG